jgi:adenylate cyclase
MATLAPARRTETELLIAFADLTRYSFMSTRVPDELLASTMDAHYERVAARIEGSGGTVVKFIGDAVLAVWSPDDADAAVASLLTLKEEVDAAFERLGWECRLVVKVHCGTVVAGPYGPASQKRFDILGKAVNACAMLDSMGVSLSVEAFRALSADARKRFKKHTPPITYIRTEDPHRFRKR